MIKYLQLAAAALVLLSCNEAPAFVQPPASEYTAARFELATPPHDTVQGAAVSPKFVRVIGIRPALGRLFIENDFQPSGMPTAVISYHLWSHYFSNDPSIIGRSIRLNGSDATVVGVTPEHFEFPKDAWVWIPRR